MKCADALGRVRRDWKSSSSRHGVPVAGESRPRTDTSKHWYHRTWNQYTGKSLVSLVEALSRRMAKSMRWMYLSVRPDFSLPFSLLSRSVCPHIHDVLELIQFFLQVFNGKTTLAEDWGEGCNMYLGITAPRFPNYCVFVATSPLYLSLGEPKACLSERQIFILLLLHNEVRCSQMDCTPPRCTTTNDFPGRRRECGVRG